MFAGSTLKYGDIVDNTSQFFNRSDSHFIPLMVLEKIKGTLLVMFLILILFKIMINNVMMKNTIIIDMVWFVVNQLIDL